MYYFINYLPSVDGLLYLALYVYASGPIEHFYV